MEYIKVNTDNISEEELLNVLDNNRRTFSMQKEAIKKLQEATKSITNEKIEIIPTTVMEKVKTDNKNEKFEEEINYYLDDLSKQTEEDLDDLSSILPSRSNNNYEKIIMRLIAETVKELKEMQEITLDELSTLSKDELKYLKKEIKLINKKKTKLQEALKKPKNKKKIEVQENKLIFIPTTSGNIRVLDEIESIPNEYYDSFKGLFLSIKDGSFKEVKRFINNTTLKGASEVRDFKIRVVFTRLSKDAYGLVTAFTKKSDNDRGYRRPIESKMADYKMIEDSIKSKLNDEEFLKENKKYEEELFRILSPNNKEKGGNSK